MKLLGAVLVSLVAVGCGRKKSDEYAPLIERAARFAKNACACNVAACAKSEQKGFSEFLDGYLKTVKDPEPPEAVKKQLEASLDEAHACVDKLEKLAEPPPTGSGGGGGTGQVQAIIDRLTKAKDAMCACQDIPCIQKVSEELTAFSADLANMTEVPTDAQIAAMTEISEHASECATKVGPAGSAEAGSGSAAPSE